MDLATLIGISLAFVVIFTAQILEGGTPGSLFLLPPLLLVFGGTFCAAMAGMVLKDSMNLPNAFKHAFTAKVRPVDESVKTLVSLAEQARRNGLLALEESAKAVEDPFLRRGVELLVDGTDPDEIREIMEAEIHAKKQGEKAAAKVFADMGAYAPTIGIVGTVMGLVHVLENLDKPETLGHSIAAAFLATLWGVLSANVIWLPIASKLKRITEIEVRQMELLVEGIMAIQAGSNPRMIEQKLLAYLPRTDRPKAGSEKDAA